MSSVENRDFLAWAMGFGKRSMALALGERQRWKAQQHRCNTEGLDG
jgi:hypothetical protein